ncbi:MAG TPA: hypothetical protein P5137_03650 [Candidatus Brocadiia bacterium]|nr:hypothetical protein [Candidatus Brocadiia bacterium]
MNATVNNLGRNALNRAASNSDAALAIGVVGLLLVLMIPIPT